jgi:hypothetical protein
MCRLLAFLSLHLILRGASSANITELLASNDGWKVMVDEQRGTHTIDDLRVPHGAGCGSALLEMTSTAELDALLDGGADGEGGARLAIFFVYGSGAEATRLRAAAALAAATAPASVCAVGSANAAHAYAASSAPASAPTEARAKGAAGALRFVVVDTLPERAAWVTHSGFMGLLPTPSVRFVFRASAAMGDDWGMVGGKGAAAGGGSDAAGGSAEEEAAAAAAAAATAAAEQRQHGGNATANNLNARHRMRSRDFEPTTSCSLEGSAEEAAASVLLWLDLLERTPQQLHSAAELGAYAAEHGRGALIGCFDGEAAAAAAGGGGAGVDLEYAAANDRALRAFAALAARQTDIPMALCRSAAACRAAGFAAAYVRPPNANADNNREEALKRWALPVALLNKRSEGKVRLRELDDADLEPWLPRSDGRSKGTDQSIRIYAILRHWLKSGLTTPMEQALPPTLKALRVLGDPARCRGEAEVATVARERAAAEEHAEYARLSQWDRETLGMLSGGEPAEGLSVKLVSAPLHTLFVFASDEDAVGVDAGGPAASTSFEALRAAYWSSPAVANTLRAGGAKLMLVAMSHPAAPKLMAEFGLQPTTNGSSSSSSSSAAPAQLPAAVLVNSTGYNVVVEVGPAPVGTSEEVAPGGQQVKLFSQSRNSYRGHVFRLDEQDDSKLEPFRGTANSGGTAANGAISHVDPRFGIASPDSLLAFFRAFEDGGRAHGAPSAAAPTVGNRHLAYHIKSSRPWQPDEFDEEALVHVLTGANFGPLVLGTGGGYTGSGSGAGAQWCAADAFVHVGGAPLSMDECIQLHPRGRGACARAALRLAAAAKAKAAKAAAAKATLCLMRRHRLTAPPSASSGCSRAALLCTRSVARIPDLPRKFQSLPDVRTRRRAAACGARRRAPRQCRRGCRGARGGGS